ncbi:MAG: hypothetical protein KAW46_03710, partial [candidate division Zixibacteria bacterium]|nr:hypothetical protein [candidate division Zixibacteria bacterium]
MTAFRSDDWAIITGIDDAGMFELINSTQFDTSLAPTDQFYIQCTRGIDLRAGSTVRCVYALVAGDDEEDFRDNASMAQELYDNNFIGPQPPATPNLTVRAADRKVYLSWSDTSEVSIDPLSGEADFVGYKLYRSDNRGKTWGEPVYNTGNNCLTLDYQTIAQYAVTNPGDPIPHSYIDTGLYNGVEYWYCLAAFDHADTITGVDALQSGFGIAGEVSNIVAVTPLTDPAGFYDAAGTVVHDYFGVDTPSEGDVIPIVFDESAMFGAEYEVVFEDLPDVTYWHLVNVTTGDTVLARQTLTNADPGTYEVADGLRVVVNNADRLPTSMEQTEFGGSDTTLVAPPERFYADYIVSWDSTVTTTSDLHYRCDYELRYTGDSTLAGAVNYAVGHVYLVPFEIWNTTTNQRVSVAVYDLNSDGVWQSWDLVIIVNYPFNPTDDNFDVAYPDYFSWWIGFDYSIFNPSPGDVLLIEGAPLNGPD